MTKKDSTKKKLEEFLTAEVPPIAEIGAVDVPIASAVIASPILPTLTPMETVLADLCRIGMASKNWHYRARGKAFYGEHLLADLVWEVLSLSDQIIEVYYMGECGGNPPLMETIARNALDIDLPYTIDGDDTAFTKALRDLFLRTINAVEDAKKNPLLKAGTHAVLDEVSQKCLVRLGLIEQTLKEPPKGDTSVVITIAE